MKIFESEIKDGLESALAENNSIAYLTEAKIVNIDESQKETYKSILAEVTNKQIDLMYLEDILASTGWNANDDVFDPEETIKAKDTPVDKQFNFMHQQDKIIGHITASKVIDFDGQELDVLKETPQKFHVVSGSVVYTKLRDKDQQEERNQLVSEILDGKWYVSMECLFPHFDYALITASGEQRIIKRNEDTAYLTKYLRAYGGTGYVDGNKIGRLLRDFTFSGKGLVTKPANKQSVILNSIANVQFNATSTIDQMEIVEMTIDQKMYDDLKAELAASRAEITTLKSKTEESMAHSFKSEIDGLKSKVTSLTDSNTALATEISNYKIVSDEKSTKISDLEKSLKETNDYLVASRAELETTKNGIANATRVAKFIKAGLEEVQANELVGKFTTLTEEQFDEVLKLREKKEDTTTATDTDTNKLKDKPVETDTGVDADLETAKANEAAPLNIPSQKSANLGEKVTSWVGKKTNK